MFIIWIVLIRLEDLISTWKLLSTYIGTFLRVFWISLSCILLEVLLLWCRSMNGKTHFSMIHTPVDKRSPVWCFGFCDCMKAKVFLLIGGGSTVFHPPLSPAVPHTCTVKKLSPGPGSCRIVMFSSILVECFDNIIILKDQGQAINSFLSVLS